MAKIKRKSAKTGAGPDLELRSIVHQVSDLYHAYQKQANTALTVIVLAVVVVMLYSFVRAGNEKKAGMALNAAYDAAASAGGGMPNYPAALQRFQDVVSQYGSTVSAAVAQYSVGNTYLAMGQPESAVKAYQEFVQRYSGRTFLLGMVYQRMGYAYAAMGNREEAVKAFTRAEETGGVGPATMELARIYERAGNNEDAQKKYQAVTERLPATTFALEARSKLPAPDMKAPLSQPAGTAAK